MSKPGVGPCVSQVPLSGQGNPSRGVCVPLSSAGTGDTLEQAAQRSCGCPITGSGGGQVGWGFEPPGLVEGVPASTRSPSALTQRSLCTSRWPLSLLHPPWGWALMTA